VRTAEHTTARLARPLPLYGSGACWLLVAASPCHGRLCRQWKAALLFFAQWFNGPRPALCVPRGQSAPQSERFLVAFIANTRFFSGAEAAARLLRQVVPPVGEQAHATAM